MIRILRKNSTDTSEYTYIECIRNEYDILDTKICKERDRFHIWLKTADQNLEKKKMISGKTTLSPFWVQRGEAKNFGCMGIRGIFQNFMERLILGVKALIS